MNDKFKHGGPLIPKKTAHPTFTLGHVKQNAAFKSDQSVRSINYK